MVFFFATSGKKSNHQNQKAGKPNYFHGGKKLYLRKYDYK